MKYGEMHDKIESVTRRCICFFFVKEKDCFMIHCIDYRNWLSLQLRVDTLTMDRWIIRPLEGHNVFLEDRFEDQLLQNKG